MKHNYKKQAHDLLHELEKQYPTYSICRHLDTALAEYTSIWGISDKEFVYLLEKYKVNLEIGGDLIASDAEVEALYKDDFLDIKEEEEDGN